MLGPLGGVTASYMNFSLGFFVGGQVLAGILGSTVTFGYGAEGKHGANYMQTAAASVAGMSGMGVLIQAMVWMGLPQPPVWQLILYMLCIGMFGVGVGMLYTPMLVDRMQLTYPSGLAVANILRALTDPVLLRQSVAKLGSGIAAGIVGGIAAGKVALLGAIELSTSTLGAGMLVGARIGIPAITSGLIFWALDPVLRLHRLARPGRAVPQDRVPHRAGAHHGRGHHRHRAGAQARPSARMRGQGAAGRAAGRVEARQHDAAAAVGRVLGRRRRRSPATSCSGSPWASSSSRSRWCSSSRW